MNDEEFEKENFGVDLASASLHELYSSFVRVGFTEGQAFDLLKLQITSSALRG